MMAHSTDKRIRGPRLQAIRERHFAKNPLCVHCQAKGIVRLATQLDHIKALANGGLDVDSNRQGLCAMHHRQKTDRDLGYLERKVVGPDGYPQD